MQKIATFLFALLLLSTCTDKQESIRPQVGDITESVYASVTIVPEGVYNVFAAGSGILDEVLVSEGDTVTKGQLIARISADRSAISVENAKLSAALAQENYSGSNTLLSNIEKEIGLAREQNQIDSLNLARQSRLWEQKIGSQTDLENRKLKYESSVNRLDLLLKKYTQSEQELANGYRQSQNAVRQAQVALGDFDIRSRIRGSVYSIYKEVGELIMIQEPLARIGSTDTFLIEMLIDEVDIASVTIGQQCFITLDAYPEQVFEAQVSKIYPLKDDRNQTFMLEGIFEDPPVVLYAGLSGEANIILSQKKHSMTIPLEYLLEGDKVLTEDGEKAVEVGLRSIDVVEILSGIDESTEILKP